MASHLSKTPRRVRRSATLLVLLLVAALMVVGGLLYTLQLMAPVSASKDAPFILVTIPAGKSARQIGEILVRRHLIRSPYSFVLASRMDGLSGHMRAGHYELSPAMPPRQIAALLALGETASAGAMVTIPEGFDVRQIAHRLAKQGLVDEQQFLTLAQTQGRTFHVHQLDAAGRQFRRVSLPRYVHCSEGSDGAGDCPDDAGQLSTSASGFPMRIAPRTFPAVCPPPSL